LSIGYHGHGPRPLIPEHGGIAPPEFPKVRDKPIEVQIQVLLSLIIFDISKSLLITIIKMPIEKQ
jgi:hypothetical protein